jgi:2-amino-4-hydroxy-6-hydroxymethyldihydropteridine diphosphokinase
VISPVYETDAVGFDGDAFYNLVVGIETDQTVAEIRQTLRAIEDARGRLRESEKFAPRTLDLDLLTWGDAVGVVDGYELPRDEILKYAFVLAPLADVAPNERHPVDGRSYRQLWSDMATRTEPPSVVDVARFAAPPPSQPPRLGKYSAAVGPHRCRRRTNCRPPRRRRRPGWPYRRSRC